LRLRHAPEITRIVGFSAVDFTMGPYFAPARRGTAGVQVDLVFDRADNVLTVCEMKYSANTVGVDVIASMKRKIELLTGCQRQDRSACARCARSPLARPDRSGLLLQGHRRS
jgi:hypothetical protein